MNQYVRGFCQRLGSRQVRIPNTSFMRSGFYVAMQLRNKKDAGSVEAITNCPPESMLLQNSKAKFLPSPQPIGSRSDRDLICTRREGFCNFLESGGQRHRVLCDDARGGFLEGDVSECILK